MFAPPAPMTGQNMYDYFTGLLLTGQKPDITNIMILFNICQYMIEDTRDWMNLRAQDISQLANPSDTFKTMKALPADFYRFRNEKPIVLYKSGSLQVFRDDYLEVPLEMAISYQSEFDKFYIDYANSQFALCGGVDQQYIIAQNYIKQLAPIAIATAWAFPARFHPIIPTMASVLYEGGIDWDDQNARMAAFNNPIVKEMFSNMKMWDANNQVQSLKGVRRGDTGDLPHYGGRINGA